MAKKVIVNNTGGIRCNKSYEGKPLEWKIEDLMKDKKPIEAISPIIYTERKKGVEPQYNIRTDRWEIAQTAMDAVSRTEIAKRHSQTEAIGSSTSESTQATNEQ